MADNGDGTSVRRFWFTSGLLGLLVAIIGLIAALVAREIIARPDDTPNAPVVVATPTPVPPTPVPPTPIPASFTLTVGIKPVEAEDLGVVVTDGGVYAEGQEVMVEAQRKTTCSGTSAYVFDRWEDVDGIPDSNPGLVIMNSDRSVVAVYLFQSVTSQCPSPAPTNLTLTVDGVNNPAFVSSAADTNKRTVTVTMTDLNLSGTTRIQVKNTRGNSIPALVLNEEGDSHVFRGEFQLTANGNGDPASNILGADDGDLIEVVASQSETKTIIVDSKGPIISDLSPTHEAITRASTIVISGEVTDSGSGLADPEGSSIKVFAATTPGAPLSELSAFANFTSVTNGFSFSLLLTLGSEGVYSWKVTATDVAGNTSTSDGDAAIPGNQDHQFEIDTTSPSMISAVVGESWDSSNGVIKKNVLNSVHITFNDKLEAFTLSIFDFLVGDLARAPILLTFPNLPPEDADNHTVGNLDLRSHVFLTMANEFDPNDQPMIILLPGAIADLAGNATSGGQVEAQPSQSP